MKKIYLIAIFYLLIAPFAYASNSFGSLSEVIGVGNVMSVGLNPSPTGAWYVVSNNTAITRTQVTSSSLLITGKAIGQDVVLVCTEPSGLNCLTVAVNVSGNVLGATIGHPVGSWVLYEGTVLYVHQNGIIPVPTWQIFLNNGGRANAIVPMSEADSLMPLLPMMTVNDSRLK